MKRIVYTGKREIRTFVDLHRGARFFIQKAERESEGSYYTTMGALLLTAFTFEAYLNHLGEKRLKFWPEIESIKVMNKCSVLCKDLGIAPDFSRRPYQTLKLLFKFRNAIAHGRSQIVEKTKEVASVRDTYGNLQEHIPKAKWEEYCTLENARRAIRDVEEIITEMHKKAGLGDYPFISGVTIGDFTSKSDKA